MFTFFGDLIFYSSLRSFKNVPKIYIRRSLTDNWLSCISNLGATFVPRLQLSGRSLNSLGFTD